MSTVQEIQEAISQLKEEERLSLLQWIHVREETTEGVENSELFQDAQVGARQLDAGQGITLEQARQLTSQWTTK